MNRPSEPQTGSVPPGIRAFVILRQVSLLSTARNQAFLLSVEVSPLCRFLHVAEMARNFDTSGELKSGLVLRVLSVVLLH